MLEIYSKVSYILEMYERFYMREMYGEVFYILDIYVRFYMREIYVVLHADNVRTVQL